MPKASTETPTYRIQAEKKPSTPARLTSLGRFARADIITAPSMPMKHHRVTIMELRTWLQKGVPAPAPDRLDSIVGMLQ